MMSSKLLSQFPELVMAVSQTSDGNMDFRFGEYAEVLENRRRFLISHDIPADKCIGLTLVHKDGILEVSEEDVSDCAVVSPEGDALVTRTKGVYLYIKVADCLPVVIYDPRQEVLALVHGAWMSMTEGIISKSVELLVGKYGCDPGDMHVYIGPGIHKESYSLRQPKPAQFPEWEPYLQPDGQGRTSVDIVGFAVDRLMEGGITPAQMEVSTVDTGVPGHFSHYRTGRFGQKDGRFCLVVGMRP